jgi:hypothetical protein
LPLFEAWYEPPVTSSEAVEGIEVLTGDYRPRSDVRFPALIVSVYQRSASMTPSVAITGDERVDVNSVSVELSYGPASLQANFDADGSAYSFNFLLQPGEAASDYRASMMDLIESFLRAGR